MALTAGFSVCKNVARSLFLVAARRGGRGIQSLVSVRKNRFAGSWKMKVTTPYLTPTSAFSSYAYKTDKSVQVDLDGPGLRIRQPLWPQAVYLPFVWLRDHCRCDKCYSHVTFQRQAVIDPSWLTLAPSDVTVHDNTLALTWPDGHQTTYDLSWLWENTFEGRSCRQPETPKQRLWDANQLREAGGVPRVSFQSFMENEEKVADVIRHLFSVGVCIVDQTPATTEGTRQAVERVCAIQETFWGSLYILEQNPEGNDLSYSNQALPPHMDGNYLQDGPGLQAFHAHVASPVGGESTLVDGLAAAARLPPDDVTRLSSTPVLFEYRDRSGRVYLNTDPIFKLNPTTKKIDQIRYCPNDVAPISSIEPSAILPFYEAYSRFSREVQREDAIFLHRLTPDEVLFVDNWRVMHGRTGFEGRRVLAGCYLGRADYLCKARMLKVIE